MRGQLGDVQGVRQHGQRPAGRTCRKVSKLNPVHQPAGSKWVPPWLGPGHLLVPCLPSSLPAPSLFTLVMMEGGVDSSRRRKSSNDIVLDAAALLSDALPPSAALLPAAPPPAALPPPSPRGVVPALEGAPEAAAISSSACEASMPTSLSTWGVRDRWRRTAAGWNGGARAGCGGSCRLLWQIKQARMMAGAGKPQGRQAAASNPDPVQPSHLHHVALRDAAGGVPVKKVKCSAQLGLREVLLLQAGCRRKAG